MKEKLKKIKPHYEKYRYNGTTGYYIHIGRFIVLITEREPDSLMVFRDGSGRMRVRTDICTDECTRTEHSGCPVDIELEDETVPPEGDETDA